MTPRLDLDVVVADDEPDVRLLLRLQLPDFGLRVVGEAETGFEAIEMVARLRPHALVIDLLMPGMNGFEAVPVLRRKFPDLLIVAYSAITGDYVRAEMARHGVPLRLKSGNPEELVTAFASLTAPSP